MYRRHTASEGDGVAEIELERNREDLSCPSAPDSLADSSPERLATLELGECFGQALCPSVFAFG